MSDPDEGAATVPQVTIIVVSYNTRNMTLDCLRSIVAETTIPYELVVIDNDSDDGSAAAIAAECPAARLMAEQRNHGFAKANNIAARTSGAKYILLLNPDTVVLNGAIDRLVEFAEARAEAGIWGGRTLFGDRTLNPSSVSARMTMWGLVSQALGLTSVFRGSAIFNPEAIPGWNRDFERDVDIVQGSFFLIRRSLWEDLDGFDTSFFMYGEETDLCLRARRVGARPAFTPTAEIIHYAGASEKVRSNKMVSLLRARITLVERHFPAWQRPLARSVLRLWPLSRALGLKILGRAEAAATWGEIWQRRSEWQGGYEQRAA